MKKNILFLLLSFTVFAQQKINGISFVASNSEITETKIKPVLNINANWVTLMPFGFMKTENDTTISFNNKKQWLNEKKEGIEKSVKLFKKNKIKVMLKPQIWIPNGGFTGHIKMNSEKNWKALENSYEKFILFYAKIAKDNSCDLFCIGTEMNTFVVARPTYWNNLIKKIKKIYTGKITYAENWDTYKTVPFITKIDYIGIDAYFPLDSAKTPTIDAINKAWQPIKKEMQQLTKKHNKKILFTEFGYQSKNYATLEPWDHSKKRTLNLKAQENALTSLFNVFWKEKWFAGGFLWKWYDTHEEAGGKTDTDYTIQNKPVEEIVRKQFMKK